MGLHNGVYPGNGVLRPEYQTQTPLHGMDTERFARMLTYGNQPPPAAPEVPFWSREAMLGKDGDGGWGNLALGTFKGLANVYMGMKQYGLAKDQFNQSKQEFGLNYDAQRQTINTQLEDRQRARVASNPGAYVSVSDYLNKNQVKARG
jgi:hypothetical protein